MVSSMQINTGKYLSIMLSYQRTWSQMYFATEQSPQTNVQPVLFVTTAKKNQGVLEVMVWSPQSHNLNIFNCVWGHMKRHKDQAGFKPVNYWQNCPIFEAFAQYFARIFDLGFVIFHRLFQSV